MPLEVARDSAVGTIGTKPQRKGRYPGLVGLSCRAGWVMCSWQASLVEFLLAMLNISFQIMICYNIIDGHRQKLIVLWLDL